MGQIFNRLKKITKAYINQREKPVTTDFYIDDNDDELEQKINEASKQTGSGAGESTSEDNLKMNESLAYSVLKLRGNPTIEEIKRAYKSIIKQYHPDKIDDMGDEIKALAEEKTKQINEAYKFLKIKLNF